MAQIQRKVGGRLTSAQNPISTFAWAVRLVANVALLMGGHTHHTAAYTFVQFSRACCWALHPLLRVR